MPFCFMVYWAMLMLFFSSQQWFFMWLVMELSTISFMGLFFFEVCKMENIILYFLTQSIASFFILFSMTQNKYFYLPQISISFLFMMSVFMKLGVAPFHGWVPAVTSNLKKAMGFLMLLVQKVIPFTWLLSFFTPKLLLLALMALLNMFWISPQNLLQSSIKMIIIYSSISHGSWLLLSLSSKLSWEMYFSMYMFLMCFVFYIFNTNMKSILQKNNLTPLFLIFFSLGGVPPLLGFYPKMIVIFNWVDIKLILLMSLILFLSLLDLFIYARLSMTGTMKIKTTKKWYKKNEIMKILFLINLSILSLIWI